jgi:hypothetical protein
MVRMMDVCVSTAPFPPLTIINDTLRLRGGDKPADEQNMTAIKAGLVIVAPDRDFWSKDLLKEIDDIATKVFTKCHDSIGIPSDDYNNAMLKYVRAVSDAIKIYKSDHPLVDSVLSRFKWLSLDKSQDIHPLPLLTGFVFNSLAKSLKMIPQALLTVSRFIQTPLIDSIDDRR